MTVEYIERVYNSYSGIYDLLFGKVFQSGRELGPELLQLEPGSRLLEVGVGTGLSLPLLPRNIDYVGIDLSKKMLDQARKRANSLGLRKARLIKMDATRLDFPDQSFDRVFAAYFISTVPDPVAVVQEMKRVCRPGGYIVFLNHFQSEHPVMGMIDKLYSPIFYRVGFKTDLNLQQLMKATGLETEIVEPIGMLGHWKAVRCINPAPISVPVAAG
ncbi:MAG: methyltransferase domain-containing protein [Verrucomicrobiota bacterium]|nr:methyltransferase domain-containing protein [Verrucomicrobiota bacterium]